MIKKTDLIFGKTGIFSDRQFYLIGDIALLMGHIGYLILFHWLGIYELQRYNYFSIFFYALMLVLIYKTTIYHSMPIRTAKLQNIDNTKCWQGWDAIRTLIHC